MPAPVRGALGQGIGLQRGVRLVVRLLLILLLALGIAAAPQGTVPASVASAAHGPESAEVPGHAHDGDQAEHAMPDHVHEALLPRLRLSAPGTTFPAQEPLWPAGSLRPPPVNRMERPPRNLV